MGSVPIEWKDADPPIVKVSWDDANEFCRQLSALPQEKQASRLYRLPTEAEWEYACRAGTTTKWSFGDDQSRVADYTWLGEISDSNVFGGISDSNVRSNKSFPVDTKKPNAWGLYDMHGNVHEWCSDWFKGYAKGAVTNPQGPPRGVGQVLRGGS